MAMADAVDSVALAALPPEVDGETERLRSPTAVICGNNWPRTTSTLSRADSSLKAAEITFGLFFAARSRTSSRAVGKAGRSRGSRSRPGGRPTARACIIGPADFELAFRRDALRHRLVERGTRLGDVGAGQLTSLGADPGSLEFLSQHILIIAIDLDQALIAHHVEIGLSDRLKHGRLDRQGQRPRRLDRVDRLPRLRLSAAATIDWLGQAQIERGRFGMRINRRARLNRFGAYDVSCLTGMSNCRPPVRQRLRHQLIGRPQ